MFFCFCYKGHQLRRPQNCPLLRFFLFFYSYARSEKYVGVYWQQSFFFFIIQDTSTSLTLISACSNTTIKNIKTTIWDESRLIDFRFFGQILHLVYTKVTSSALNVYVIVFPGNLVFELFFSPLKLCLICAGWLSEKVWAPDKVVSCRCSTLLVEIVKVQWQLKRKVSTQYRFMRSGSSGQSREDGAQLAFGCSLGVCCGFSVSDLKHSLSISLPLSYLVCCRLLILHSFTVWGKKRCSITVQAAVCKSAVC